MMLWILILYFQSSQWTEHLGITNTILLLSFIFGILVARSNYSKQVVFLISIFLALFLIPLIMVLSTNTNADVWTGFFQLFYEMGIIIRQFVFSESFEFPTAFIIFTAALTWVVGFWGVYELVRNNNPWLSISMGSILLISIDSFMDIETRNSLFSGAFILFALLLIIRVFFENKDLEWAEGNITVDNSKGITLNKSLVYLLLFLVAIIWNIPIFIKSLTPATRENREMNRFFRTIEERFQDATAPLRGENYQKLHGFGRSLPLGLSASQSQDVLFTVKSSASLPEGSHFYWRAWIYDDYEDGSWDSAATDVKILRPEQDILNFPDTENQQVFSHFFTIYQPLSVFLSGGLPKSLSNQAEILYFSVDDEIIDVHSIVPDSYLARGSEYRIDSWISFPSQQDLLTAAEYYPGWLEEKYTRLPAGFSKEIRALAFELTRDQKTIYEKAKAITDYLRQNIVYSEKVSSPPNDQDIMEWFLFDYKQGYCNYSATAEVLLLRSIGIPSRLVNGYAEGEVLPDGVTFLVRGKDAHAWVEVYFPNVGWVPFEPTSTRPEPQFPEEEMEDEITVPGIRPTIPAREPDGKTEVFEEKDVILNEPKPNVSRPSGSKNPIILIIIVVAGILLFWFSRKTSKVQLIQFPRFVKKSLEKFGIPIPKKLEQWISTIELPRIEKCYRSVLRTWLSFGNSEIPNGTPREKLSFIAKKLPQVKVVAKKFIDEYEKSIYGNRKIDINKVNRMYDEIRRSIILSKLGSIKLFFRKSAG